MTVLRQLCYSLDGKLGGKVMPVSLSSRQTDNTVPLTFMVSINDGLFFPPQ